MAHEIVPNINRLAQAVRATGGAVVWIQTAYTDETLDKLVDALRHGRARRAREAAEALAVVGSKGYELFAEPQGRAGRTLIVEKKRYSAFIQGSSNLEEVLRTRGLDTLLITGTVTNVCCESTARDAMMRNFKTIMVTDGNAANTDEDHNAALSNFYLTFGDIMSTDFAIGCLTRQRAEGPRRGGVERLHSPLMLAALMIGAHSATLVLASGRPSDRALRSPPRCRAPRIFFLVSGSVSILRRVVVHLLHDVRAASWRARTGRTTTKR